MQKQTTGRLNKLEDHFVALINRVDGHEEDIFSLKRDAINQKIGKDILSSTESGYHLTQHNIEKRQLLYSPPQCIIKPCAFDLSYQENKNNSTKNKITTELVVKKPASCEDLKILGHSLSGFYMIETNLPNNINLTNKILTVFCDFSLKKLKSSVNLKGK